MGKIRYITFPHHIEFKREVCYNGENQVLFLSQMEESKMAKQVHIRVDDDIYKELSDYSVVSGQSMQDCLSVAIRQMLVKAKEEPSQDCNGYTFIDLFAGIGGMRLAFESAGGCCVYSNEWNKYSQQTYYANFGVQPDGDITKVQAESIPDHDILVAGFPCQPFSIAGVSKKNSLGRATGFEDKTQGTLFFDVCRILKAKRPKAFMLENVKNLCSHDKGRTFQIIQESLRELNYKVFFQIIDGKGYVPQHRERIVIVGFDKERYGENVSFSFDLHPLKKQPVVRDILEKRLVRSIRFQISSGFTFKTMLQNTVKQAMVLATESPPWTE